MPVKYTRETLHRGLGPQRKHLPQVTWERQRLNQRQRLIVIYLGLVFVFVLILFLERIWGAVTVPLQPITEGPAVVTGRSRSVEDGVRPRFRLDLEVQLGDGTTVACAVETDAESWDRVAENDVVEVTYRLAKTRDRATVYSIRLPAPSGVR